MINFAELDKLKNGNYIKLLTIMGSLTRLFSESDIPFIYYRFAENIFCDCFNAQNLSRSDTAFDAKIDKIGIGLKTFIYNKNYSVEKIAEFNALSETFQNLKDFELAEKLSIFRNERINLAKRTYDIEKSLYHIVGRTNSKITLFETDYDEINISNLQKIKKTKGGISFSDGINEYSFNKSKSTLFRKFIISDIKYEQNIQILDDVYPILLNLNLKDLAHSSSKKAGIDYIILPLYGMKNGKKYVYPKAGLNQWNADGRPRDKGEMYITYPAKVRKFSINFFPPRDIQFLLKVPSGEILNAKMCQDNSKALMTNPNNAISDWLLRKVLKLKEGELLTYNNLENLGFDSVIIIKENNIYKIDIMPLGSYEEFLENLQNNNF